MKRRFLLASPVAFSLMDGHAQSEPTVGDLLARGGRLLSKDEVMAAMAGATMSGVQGNSGTRFQNEYRLDGTIAGTATTRTGAALVMSGTWSIEPGGQLVQNLRNSQGQEFKGAGYLFKVGNDWYYATSDAPSALALPRNIRR